MWRLGTNISYAGPDIHISSCVGHLAGMGEMGYQVAVFMYAIDHP